MVRTILKRVVLVIGILTTAAPVTFAQTQDPTSDAGGIRPAWEVRASAATYFLPDDDNYVQPVVTVDHNRLHLEGRYNYEDRSSVSAFVGWNLAFGTAVTLELTPMIGGVVGDTDGVIPALELTVGFRRLELYSEGEYVIDLDESGESWTASGRPVAGDGVMVTVTFVARGEPFEIEIPFSNR